MIAGLVTESFTRRWGSGDPCGILTQLGLYSINLRIMGGKANQAISVDKYDLLVSLRYVKGVAFYRNTIFVTALIIVILIAVLYWFFGQRSMLHPCHRFQSEHVTCPGHQYRFHKDLRSYDL